MSVVREWRKKEVEGRRAFVVWRFLPPRSVAHRNGWGKSCSYVGSLASRAHYGWKGSTCIYVPTTLHGPEIANNVKNLGELVPFWLFHIYTNYKFTYSLLCVPITVALLINSGCVLLEATVSTQTSFGGFLWSTSRALLQLFLQGSLRQVSSHHKCKGKVWWWPIREKVATRGVWLKQLGKTVFRSFGWDDYWIRINCFITEIVPFRDWNQINSWWAVTTTLYHLMLQSWYQKLPNHWWTSWYHFRDTKGYYGNSMSC